VGVLKVKHYCLGFLVIEDYDGSANVLLIKKNQDCKLEYLRNKLNGLGGSIEENETPLEAMIREFSEETRIDVKIAWKERGIIIGDGYDVTIFNGGLTVIPSFQHDSFPIKSDEGEIDFYDVDSIHNFDVVDNLPILLPLINSHNNYKYFLDYRGEEGMGSSQEPLIWCEKE
jgi:8-oxo-dGTP diphosphatase